MPFDPISALSDRQLKAWKSNAQVVSAQLYLISRAHSLDVEVSKIGVAPTLSKEELKSLLQRVSSEDRLGFEAYFGSQRGYVYPLRQESMLQGVWVLFPSDGEIDWAGWTRDAQQFSEQLFALRQASLGNPPTFRQLVESFPAYDDSESEGPEQAPPLHWERSKSRVTVAVEDELSATLIVDHLPIF